MRAIVWTAYGGPDVLQLREVEKPIPRANEVLIRIHATTVTAGDCELRSLRSPIWLQLPMRMYIGVRRPKRLTVLGQELAGEIEAAGKEVKRFKEGDQVFAATGFRLGTYAEYTCVAERGTLAMKPANMTYDEAATVPMGGLNALLLRKTHVQEGQSVLINGAGGSIGTIAVQLAKSFGAEVTAVDSTMKLDLLHSLGADRVIDYTHEDFTKSRETYDVIFDIVGKAPFSGCIRLLKEKGVYLLGNPTPLRRIRGRWATRTGGKRVVAEAAPYKTEDLIFLKDLIEAGKIRSAIDRRYPLDQVAEAHRYVETGRKRGSVVIAV